MAEQTLVRQGARLPVPDGVDDVTVVAFANPGMAAWKTVIWEGKVAAGQNVLVLGANGTSGRIASRLAKNRGARVVAVGRDRAVLDRLAHTCADAVIRADRPADELATAIADQGPYDLITDYLWGAPAEATFAALARGNAATRRPTRYILVGMSAGEQACVPAMALGRVTPRAGRTSRQRHQPPGHGRRFGCWIRRSVRPDRRRRNRRRRASRCQPAYNEYSAIFRKSMRISIVGQPSTGHAM
jgi:NADPH:quinone reductase-like Zn-dependent oxidoreductase